MFENSAAESTTSTEKAIMQSFAKQIGDIGAIITGIVSAVFFTMLLVAGNTMAQSVRERTNELGGAEDARLQRRPGARPGARRDLPDRDPGRRRRLRPGRLPGLRSATRRTGLLPIFYIPTGQFVFGVVLILVLGLVTGALPALQARRLRIVDALRRA